MISRIRGISYSTHVPTKIQCCVVEKSKGILFCVVWRWFICLRFRDLLKSWVPKYSSSGPIQNLLIPPSTYSCISIGSNNGGKNKVGSRRHTWHTPLLIQSARFAKKKRLFKVPTWRRWDCCSGMKISQKHGHGVFSYDVKRVGIYAKTSTTTCNPG